VRERSSRQELLGQKKSIHVGAFRFLVNEIARDLSRIAIEGDADARLASDSERLLQVGFTMPMLVEHIMAQVREVLGRHEELAAELYTNDGVFRRLVQEMMDARMMAESHLRLYLEDHSHGICSRVTETLMRGAHRELIAYRTQKLALLGGGERREVAERLCVLRGYAAERVGETNEAGEDALVRAAADGAVGVAGVALLLAAGAATGGEALAAAALYGQREAVVALIDAGVHVDSRDQKV
jgi:hypothetical protein